MFRHNIGNRRPGLQVGGLALLLLCPSIRAASLSLPFTIQANFPSFSLGANLSTGAWSVSGTGTWSLDASTGIGTQTANLAISFPALGTSILVSFTATGPFIFARENATHRVGILAESQGGLTINLGASVAINLAAISSMLPITESVFPPFPTTPPSQLSLPALPPGFTPLPAGSIPPVTELGSVGNIMASGTAKTLILPLEDFRGVGTIKLVPSSAACPAGTSNPLNVFAGTWTFAMDGQAPSGTPFAAAGQFAAAVNPVNNTPTGLVAVTQSSSTTVSMETDTGTYQVLADCSGGSMVFNVSNQPTSFDFWFANAFNELSFVSTKAGVELRGSAKRF
jgi:hypothetical protein